MSDSYYSTPNYVTTSTPASRYGEMTGQGQGYGSSQSNPLQYANAPQGNAYGYYANVDGDGMGNSGGVQGGGYGSTPGYNGQVNAGTENVPDYTQPPPQVAGPPPVTAPPPPGISNDVPTVPAPNQPTKRGGMSTDRIMQQMRQSLLDTAWGGAIPPRFRNSNSAGVSFGGGGARRAQPSSALAAGDTTVENGVAVRRFDPNMRPPTAQQIRDAKPVPMPTLPADYLKNNPIRPAAPGTFNNSGGKTLDMGGSSGQLGRGPAGGVRSVGAMGRGFGMGQAKMGGRPVGPGR